MSNFQNDSQLIPISFSKQNFVYQHFYFAFTHVCVLFLLLSPIFPYFLEIPDFDVLPQVITEHLFPFPTFTFVSLSFSCSLGFLSLVFFDKRGYARVFFVRLIFFLFFMGFELEMGYWGTGSDLWFLLVVVV